MKETSYPTADSVVDNFTHIVLRAFKQSISRSSTKHCCVPIPLWAEECRDAVEARNRDVFAISDVPLLRQILSPSNAFVPEHRELSCSLNVSRGKCLPLLSLIVHLLQLCGNVYDDYEAYLPTRVSQPFR